MASSVLLLALAPSFCVRWAYQSTLPLCLLLASNAVLRSTPFCCGVLLRSNDLKLVFAVQPCFFSNGAQGFAYLFPSLPFLPSRSSRLVKRSPDMSPIAKPEPVQTREPIALSMMRSDSVQQLGSSKSSPQDELAVEQGATKPMRLRGGCDCLCDCVRCLLCCAFWEVRGQARLACAERTNRY